LSRVELLDPNTRAMLLMDGQWRELADYAVVSGHFFLSALLRITGPSSIATVLREPRSRLLSHYAAWRLSLSGRTAWRGDTAPDHALRPLDEFLADPEVSQATDNLSCRMLLVPDLRMPEQGFTAADDIADLASQAIAALETLGFVGVVELGDSMWVGLSRFFEVPLTPMRLNTTAAEGLTADAPDAKLKITEHTLDLLEARTAADGIAYRHVLRSKGYSGKQAQRLAAAAFADELVRIGDVAGASASELREHLTRRDAQLQDRDQLLRKTQEDLAGKDADLAAIRAKLAATRAELAGTQAKLAGTQVELAADRNLLDVILSSKSWRVTEPARAAKRALTKLRV
jgi:hypothetical protein